jgi:tungstate transport system ATP-binding protein
LKTSILPLCLEDVCFEVRGKLLLNKLNARFEPGGKSFILGPNGAGKSLSLRIAHGLLKPTAGRVRWQEPGSERLRQAQAMVFERPVLLPRSVRSNVEFALAHWGIPSVERRARANDALERTGLVDLASRDARFLSSGEKQRLALARAWALEPQVLFLDEPTAALDPAAIRAVETIINSVAEAGTKIIMTTHDLAQARRLADDILFLNRGVLVERTTSQRFFDEPVSDAAKAFVRGELYW